MSKHNALTEPVYYILLSLLTPMQLSKGFIAEYKSDPSKKEYIITEDGRSVLNAELNRLKELVKNGEELLEG